jgi:hypothetical protein
MWFAKIQRHIIASDVFTWIKDPEKKLIRYICLYNKAPRLKP